MKSISREILENLSRHCHNQITLYRFNTTTLEINDKYREGRLAALNYLSELSLYYIQEEKRLKECFREQILVQMQSNASLNDGDYKQGLYDALNDTLDEFISLEERLSST